MGAAAIPLILSAVSAGAQVYNSNQTQKRQDEELAQGIRIQGQRQREADAQVDQQVKALSRSTPEEAQAKATQDFMDQLRRTRAQAIGGSDIGGERYAADLSGAQSDVANTGRNEANLMARISAPGIQRQQEGQGMNRLASVLGGIQRNSAADQFLTELRARGIKRNPWIDAVADVAGGVAEGMASGTGGSTLSKSGIARVGRGAIRTYDSAQPGWRNA